MSEPTTSPKPENKIWFLHALRGIAACLVVIDHLIFGFWAGNSTIITVFAYLKPIINQTTLASPLLPVILNRLGLDLGTFGVALFFLISGFVIPISLEKIRGMRFLIARAFRIYPTYIIGFSITFLAIFLYTWSNKVTFPYTWQNYLAQILLIRDWQWFPSIDGISWTLETEIKFYLLICLIASIGKLNSWKAIMATSLFLASVNVTLAGQYRYLFQNEPLLYRLVYVITYSSVSLIYMLLGVCFYNFYKKHWSPSKLIVALLVVGGLFILAYREGPIQNMIGTYTTTYLPAFSVFGCAYFLRGFWRYNRTINFLAEISFPLYVIHGLNGYILMTVLNGLGINPYINLALTLIVVFCAAYLLHRFVEQPSNQFGKKLSHNLRLEVDPADLDHLRGHPSTTTSAPAEPYATQKETSSPGRVAYQDAAFYSQGGRSRWWKHRRLLMSLFMVGSDVLCLSLSVIVAVVLWHQVRTDFVVENYLAVSLPVSACFVLIYLLIGLYPGIGIGPVEELRRFTITSSVIMLGLVTLGFYLNNIPWSRAILALSWVFILISVPLSRKVFRRLAVRLGLWGIPAVVIGDTETAARIFNKLRKRPLTGLWPVLRVAAPTLRSELRPAAPRATPVLVEQTALFDDIQIALIACGKTSFDVARNILGDQSSGFNRIIVIFDEKQVGPIWFSSIQLAEHLGLEVVHNLLSQTQQAIKRLLDLTLILLLTPFLLVFFGLTAILIKLDSPGPAFYSQKRIGHSGREIRIWKFRSMAANAEELLGHHLEKNPSLQKEWDQNFKLKNDPRITRFGNLLRRTSLDELPQIWNVLRGEMSLIGPRPIVAEELALYGDEFQIYQQVLPGLTGMWQISGRNDLPYSERVSLDVYYVQNWSIWLDIHILLHTILAAIQGRGAY